MLNLCSPIIAEVLLELLFVTFVYVTSIPRRKTVHILKRVSAISSITVHSALIYDAISNALYGVETMDE
jgi:hypothetical protein